MRTLWFLSISAVAFFSILALSWNYKLVVEMGAAPLENAAIVCAETVSNSSPFSGFEKSAEFMYYEPGKGFRPLDFAADEVAGLFELDGRLLLLFPNSYAFYRLEGDSLLLDGTVKYYPQPDDCAAFECVAAARTKDGVTAFFSCKRGEEEDSAELMYADLAGDAFKPLVRLADLGGEAVVSAVSDGGDTLVIWRTFTAPREICWALRSGGDWSLQGKCADVMWASPPFPLIEDGRPWICYRTGTGPDFLMSPLTGDEESGGRVLRISGLPFTLGGIVKAGKLAFGTDGVKVAPLEPADGGYRPAGEPVEVGNAILSPQGMVLVEQLILIAVLMAFSFLLAGGGLTKGRSGLYPANLMLRFSAFAFDSLLTGAAAAAVFSAYLSLAGVPLRLELLSLEELRVFQYLASFFLIAYGVFFEFLSLRTPGKRMFGLLVLSLRGGRPRFAAVFVRNLMKPVDLLLSMMLVTPLLMIFTPLHQRVGDLLSHTVVVRRMDGTGVRGGEPREAPLEPRISRPAGESDDGPAAPDA